MIKMTSTGWGRQTSPDFIEETVELELGAEVAEAAVAERLERPVGDERAQQVDVGHEGLQVGVLVGNGISGLI